MQLPPRQYSRHLIRHWVKLAIAIFFISIFLYLSLSFEDNYLDKYVMEMVEDFRTPFLNGPAVDITALGSVTLLTLFTFFILILFALKKRWMDFAQLFIAQAGSGIISRTSKEFYMRPRPTMVEKLVEVSNYSYPSGHSLATATFYVTIGLLLCEYYKSHRSRVVIFMLGFLMMGLVGLSRIYLGVHYPSDVIGGFALGSAWALLLPALMSFGRRSDNGDFVDEHKLPARN